MKPFFHRLGLKPMCWDLNPAKPCLGLESPWLGLKPSQNPQYLVLGPGEAQVLDVSSQKEFSERQNDRLEVDLFREKHAPQTE